MRVIFMFALLVSFAFTAQAQFPSQVKVLKAKVNGTISDDGDLANGQYVDLTFGFRGSVNCFTEAQRTLFDGKHRLYAFEVPANTKILVEMTASNDMSLYGYMITTDRYDVPPYLENVSKEGCSSSAKPMGELERIMMKTRSTPMYVIVGVTGVQENETGTFKLKVTTRQ